MSTFYLASLAVVVVVLAVVRFATPQPAAVARRRAVLPPSDLALLVVGVVLLALHCGSMFFRSTTSDIGLGGYASVVDRFGPASMVLYSVPALLVMIALRHLQPVALTVVGAALIAVGVTMYDGGGLTAHLSAIFITIVCLVLAMLFGSRPVLRASAA